MKSLLFLVICSLFFSCQSQKKLSLKNYQKDVSNLRLKTKILRQSAKNFRLAIEIKNSSNKKLYLNIPSGYYWGDFLFIRSPKNNRGLQKHITLDTIKKDKKSVQIFALVPNEKVMVNIDMKLIEKQIKGKKFRILNTGHHDFYFPEFSGTYVIKVIFASRLSPLHYSNQIPENSIIWQGTAQSYDILLKI